MFALWYLSLAVDELRKRFGWTFFDIFYKTNKTDTKALDNKPATSKSAEPVQPSVSKPEPTVTPKAASTPAPAPAPKPAPAPVVKPETPPAPKPAPVVEPPKPKTEPIVPKPTPEPVAKPTPEPVVKPTPEPVAKPSPPPAEVKPVTPISPPKPVEQKVNDAMDKKLMEISKPKENGEQLKNNLKNATMDFLSGEANAQLPSKS